MEGNTMRDTVHSYKSLSGELENHPVLIKDKTMIQFLAYSLTSPDVEVAQLSLDTLDNLMNNDVNRMTLRSIFGVSESLKSASEREDLNDIARQKADNIYNVLMTSTPTTPLHITSTPIIRKSVNRRKLATHTVTFQVQGLRSETRQELESIVVGIQGIVSVVVDVESQRCIIRTLQCITPQLIAEEIADKTDMVPRLVLRNKNNQEFLKNIVGDERDETSESLPPYLEEGYSEPVKDSAVLSFQTLKTNASSWLNAATSFLQNSFYW